MPKYRGYVVANRGPKGRTAMRDSGKAHSTKAGAIADMKRDNSRWMKKNYSDEWARKANFQYGAVPDGKFADGSEGNKKLLKWHDANQEGRKELLGKKGFMRGQLQDQLNKTNKFAKRNLYPPGSGY
tara:strand:- start:1322 stop:1702 length:381 start_codon:yes stop_codon:yes gene_type:complete